MLFATTEYIFFSSAHGTFSRIDHILGHKSSLGKFKKIEIISSIFSDYNAMRLDINYRKKSVRNTWGFPGGAVVESLPANAGDVGSSPGLGGSHVLQSSWACEPRLLSLRVWSLCSATGEAGIVRGPCTAMKSGPHLPQLEKALAQKRRPNTAINK